MAGPGPATFDDLNLPVCHPPGNCHDLLEEFREIMRGQGLEPSDLITDGRLHRCPTTGKPESLDGAYIIHLDPPAALWWKNWRTDESGTHSASSGGSFSPQDDERAQARMMADKAQRQEETSRRHAEAAQNAQASYDQAMPCTSGHPYLTRKGVPPLGEARQRADGTLLLPIRDQHGALSSLQCITLEGDKRFFPGGRVQGGRLFIPGNESLPLCLCEGYATGASIRLAMGCTVSVAFSAGNLLPVARSLRDQHPAREIIICADKDESGTGQQKGEAAATAINARLVIPVIPDSAGSDFNDLHQQAGLEEVRRQIMEVGAMPCAPDPAHPKLKALGIGEFLDLELPPREYLLYPVIQEQGLAIAYAPRGVGKTFVAMSMALAVACGKSVFGWQAPQPRPVLYIDGEMPAQAMQERFEGLLTGMGADRPNDDRLRIITPDTQDVPMPDLATTEGQKAVEEFMHGVALVVVDNLVTLCRTGKENEAQSWQPMQTWLLDLRRRGISVLAIHHAGKSGDQRGTSAKEDIMDTVISLRRPEGYKVTEGARFEVHLTKSRGIAGDAVKPFEAQLDVDGAALRWTAKDIDNVKERQVQNQIGEGKSVRRAAKELGMSKSAVGRLKKKAETRA